MNEQRTDVAVARLPQAGPGQPVGVAWVGAGVGLWLLGQLTMLLAGALPLAPAGVLTAALFGLAAWSAGLVMCIWRLLVRRRGWASILAVGLGLVLATGLVLAVQVLRSLPPAAG